MTGRNVIKADSSGEVALPEHLERAKKRYKAQSRAERTRQAYARAWAQFEA
jgi:hypothetical protein